MLDIDDKKFEAIIGESMDELPEEYMKNLSNVAITYEDQPTEAQRQKLKLRGDQSLFGLYEGVPLPQRGISYNLVLPDKITIFKLPILSRVHDEVSLKIQVKHTLWHEIAHYYGLNHERIHEIERHWH